MILENIMDMDGGFINPFIFNKNDTLGFKLDYNTEKYKIFANYLNFPKISAAEILTIKNNQGTILDNFDGFLGKKEYSECNIGITSENNIKIPFSFMLVLSQLNKGEGWNGLVNQFVSINTFNTSETSNTNCDATTAIQKHLFIKQKLNCLTTTISKEIKPNFDLNCALSCANVNYNDLNNANIKDTILKYSLGCVSKCNYSNNINIAYGFNIGTPAYLKSKVIPFVCEVNCLVKLYGLNIPVYFDYMNRKEGRNSSGNLIYDSALTCGIKPLTIFGIEKNEKGGASCFTKDIINCIEG